MPRLIDADALEKTGIPFTTHGGATFIALGSVRTAPTIEAEPVRHGRWVMKSTCGPHTEKPHCSVCDKIPKSICFEPYCPNCGAKMMDGDDHA